MSWKSQQEWPLAPYQERAREAPAPGAALHVDVPREDKLADIPCNTERPDSKFRISYGRRGGHKLSCTLIAISLTTTAHLDVLHLSASCAVCLICCACTEVRTRNAVNLDRPGFILTISSPVFDRTAITDGLWHINYLSLTCELWEGSLYPAGGTAERIPSALFSNTLQE